MATAFAYGSGHEASGASATARTSESASVTARGRWERAYLARYAMTTPLAPGTVIIRNNIVDPKKGTHTTINFRLKKPQKVTVTVYDLAGRPVKVLYSKTGNVGLNEVIWDGKNKNGRTVVPGVYYVLVLIGKDRYVHKVLVAR